ncbi:5-guanidino-2-oxopentanoate decarboxylase [Albidovulum sp.]
MTTVGKALVQGLVARGVDTVFGIPGVHTVELYRGLGTAPIRHVTPRHEQGAGFMADGYARVSGRPGVAFVITGPGLVNTLTPMAQARADRIPVLVISGVNRLATLGRGQGCLHELPDQQALAAQVALASERITDPGEVGPALARAFAGFASARPGPRHIEVPVDVMPLPAAAADDPSLPAPSPSSPSASSPPPSSPPRPVPAEAEIARAASLLAAASRPLILAGGGARFAGAALAAVARALDAPVVQTVNARGLLHGDPLSVPASPSLRAVRALMAGADAVLAVGTEFGPTDYDMYSTGAPPPPARLVRIDIDAQDLARLPADIPLCGDAGDTLARLAAHLPAAAGRHDGAARAAAARAAARAELAPDMARLVAILEALRDAFPERVVVGDSTQVVYAGNLFYDHDRPAGWFNAATGFGALGYAIPAAIGAALARPGTPVLCHAGDGGAQFSLAELMTAAEEALPIRFLIWNNRAYGEIAASMRAAGVVVTGCHPAPPDFAAVARACAMPHRRAAMSATAIVAALAELADTPGPAMVEIEMPPA